MSVLDWIYWFDGDTIIEDKRYTKIFSQRCYSETECGGLGYYAAVREDTLGKKIYCIQANDGVERLLADFNVKEGDVVTVHSFWPHYYVGTELETRVEFVDSILINNQYRRRINIVDDFGISNFPPDSWVEGFGSIVYGLFSPSPTPIADGREPPIFLCLQVDGELLYQHQDYSVCYVKHGGSNIDYPERNGDFKIYPTITDNTLRVETNTLPYSYRIYNSLGALVTSGVSDKNKIDVSLLRGTVYYIRFYTKNNQPVYTGKFIKL
jgi:hypothetical protein